MSQTTKEILMKVRKMVPPMLEKFHKGQMGRIAVIGGSEDYTGAPYFSAMASARLGADMSHVICTPTAAAVIKTYSPNLMVHPLMRASNTASPHETASHVASTITAMLPRLHVLVIGPGLGRDPLMQETCALVIKAAREQNIPFILDADGLMIAIDKPGLVDGYKECILTPNVVEFGRLCKSKGIEASNDEKGDGEGEGSKKLANAFGGVTIVQKGAKDYISNGDKVFVSDMKGGLKRSGGQGDTLTGALATFLGWRKAYMDGLWETEGGFDGNELLALAAFGGSSLTRECSRLAFAKKGRSLQASDLTEEIFDAYNNLFEGSGPKL